MNVPEMLPQCYVKQPAYLAWY